jgi:hypothetical protein
MNQPWKPPKQKSRQWRFIIIASLMLIFGKDISDWAKRTFSFDQMFAAITAESSPATAVAAIKPLQLVIDVKNDTPNDYTIATKVQSGKIDFEGNTFSVGEIKRFIISPMEITATNASGDIVFSSTPMNGDKNTTCQEIHILTYDLKYANRIKKPLNTTLSAIASRLECKENTAAEPEEE